MPSQSALPTALPKGEPRFFNTEDIQYFFRLNLCFFHTRGGGVANLMAKKFATFSSDFVLKSTKRLTKFAGEE